MIRLIKIDLIKLANYRTFWFLTIMCFLLMSGIASAGMEALKWIDRTLGGIDEFDVMRVPLYHFPDIWQNLAYFCTLFFKYILAIVVIISFTNEISYKTVRQNIIDGFDRRDFLISKMSTVVILSLVATVILFLISLITGSIYSPASEMSFMFKGIQFIPAYFLDTLAFLSFAALVAVLVKRSGLSMGTLLIYIIFEYIFSANLSGSMEFIGDYLPIHAINSLIEIPYPKYVFQEIQDYVKLSSVLLVSAYTMLFVFLTYRVLKSRDL